MILLADGDLIKKQSEWNQMRGEKVKVGIGKLSGAREQGGGHGPKEAGNRGLISRRCDWCT